MRDVKAIRNLALLLLAVAFVFGCSKGDVIRGVRIAATGDVASARRLAAEKAVRYAADPKAIERDMKRFQDEFRRLVKEFKRAVDAVWGRKEVKEPKPKEYVKYTQNYFSRALVDFDSGVITAETLDQKNPLASLKNAVVTILLTPDDPRAVDLHSAKPIKLGDIPFLFREVKDHEGRDIRWSWRAGRFADYLIENRLHSRKIETQSGGKIVHYLAIPMVADHHQLRARKYRPFVERFSKRFSISKNLVYAIIKTESDFNPYAVSEAPAFGLMQIVPTTAGSDVYKFLNNKEGLPSKGFLFRPENNIHYGAAYLYLLHYKYLIDIQNPVSREYCVIAAYNTGAGNVLRTFDRDRSRAPRRINMLDPLQVYHTLRRELPYDETRRYLAKVMNAKKEFVSF